MIDDKIIDELREYLKDNYIPSNDSLVNAINSVSSLIGIGITGGAVSQSFSKVRTLRYISEDASDYIKEHRKPEGFSHVLDRKRKEKGLEPAELYKKANVDRRQYSRYMGPEGRHPSKNTVISFALALKLDRKDFDEFMQTAGYALSNSSSRDVCVMYCLEKGIYDINEVNALLFAIGTEPLTRDTA